jgi:ABC-type Fe3+-hydroxamate transport system substrate-binding protein
MIRKYLISIIFTSYLLSGGLASATERVISLKPNITEIVFALGKGEELVGVTTYCDYPAEAQKIDKIADYVHADVERILAKKPTLVLGSEENSLKKEIDFLKAQGIRVELFPFGRLDDIANSIEKMGVVLQADAVAKKLADQLRQQLKNFHSSLTKPKVIMVLGTQPLVVVGSNNLFNDMIEALGAINPASTSRLRYPTFGNEQLIASHPDVLIDLSMGSDIKTGSAMKEIYKTFDSIPAIKNKKVYTLDMSNFRPSQRIVEGMKELEKILIP